MLDTFDIKVPTDGWVYDPAADGGQGADVEAFTLLFTTPGRVKMATVLRSVQVSDAGGRTVASATRELHIPVDSPAVPPGAVGVCTAVGASSDPSLLGARLRLAGAAPGSQTTARRLEVREVLT